MQTFLPHPSFIDSAAALDTARLVKQRVETFQSLRALTDPTYGWQHHPAVKMWHGHVDALTEYGAAIHAECERRGIADTKDLGGRIAAFGPHDAYDLPPWVGDPRFHRSHQSNLVRKLPAHYAPQFKVPDDVPLLLAHEGRRLRSYPWLAPT